MTQQNHKTSIEKRIESLEEQLAREREARQELEAELTEEREARQELEERMQEREDALELRTDDEADTATLTDVWIANLPVGRIVESNRQDVDELEQTLESGEPQAAAESDPAEPPIFDLLRTPERALEDEPSARRARHLWEDIGEYADRTPKGLVLPAGRARRILASAEPTGEARIDSKLTGRALELIVDLTREAAYLRDNGGERQLVVPKGWQDVAREAAPPSALEQQDGTPDTAVS